MKKAFFIVVSLLLTLNIYASGHEGHDHSKMMKKMNYQAVSAKDATILQKGDEKTFCPICGMTLPMFYKTNHASNDGAKTKQYCSIHCMVEDREMKGSKLSDLKVVDNSTLKFIDVKDAYYVFGSKKPGTMSMVSKYAFGTKDAALAFAKKNGGEVKTFAQVEKIVADGIKKEKAMIEKRQAKMRMMGKKFYNENCKKTDKTFNSTAQAKAYLKSSKICGEVKGKTLQAIGLYLSN